jgi:hypothetical protein
VGNTYEYGYRTKPPGYPGKAGVSTPAKWEKTLLRIRINIHEKRIL